MTRHVIALKSSFSEGNPRSFEVAGNFILVVMIEGEFLAVSDVCTHAKAKLSAGPLVGKNIICPLHGARFDLQTGKALSPPARRPLNCYTVGVEGENVYIEL